MTTWNHMTEHYGDFMTLGVKTYYPKRNMK